MPLTFIPHSDDTEKGSLEDRMDVLRDAAERYRAAAMDVVAVQVDHASVKLMTPRDMKVAYNWEEISRILREVRELPELNSADKARKVMLLTKLAEVYEVLRSAKMSKLEAVRLALISEAAQLRGGAQLA